MNILQKILVASALGAFLFPSLASARPPKGYAKVVRDAISKRTGVKSSEVRYRSRIDRTHDADGHVHIVGHEVRDVFFRAGRATGRAKTDNTPIGGPTRVLRVKVDAVKPWQ